MEKFLLILKNAKLKSYNLIRWLLLFLNIIALYIVSFSKPGSYGDRFGITGILQLAILFLFVKRTEKFGVVERRWTLLGINAVIIFFWLRWNLYLPAIATILFEVIYLYAIRKFEVHVERGSILYPSFPRRRILWNELQNIILKDGILTIDFRNNKLIQQDLDEDNAVNEKEFNEFCQQQLSK
jgi:hypothetical protein